MATPDWRWDAACKDTPTGMFFTKDADVIAAAKRVCYRCPVRKPCLDYAMYRREPYGVWGGLTVKQRNGLKRNGIWTEATA